MYSSYNLKAQAWKLLASDLLYVGEYKSDNYVTWYKTIGDLAEPMKYIAVALVRWEVFYGHFSNGYDDSSVKVEIPGTY